MIPPGAEVHERAPRLVLALSLVAVLAFVLLVTLPFAGQAFHIDDAIFWDFARQNLDTPFQQHLPDYKLMGVDVPEFRDTHPPLDQLYLAAIMRVTGSHNELPLHLGFIIFPVITGVSMFFMARRFTGSALLATFLLLATPTFMAASHTLMGDLPMTALWMAATAFYVYGTDRDDGRLLALAGVSAALAVFAGYQALALLLLLPAYAWLKGRLTFKTAIPLAIPLLGFGAYSLFSLHQYGSLPRFTHFRGLSLKGSNLLVRIQGNLLLLGGVTVFPLMTTVIFGLRSPRWLLMLVSASVIGVTAYSVLTGLFLSQVTMVLFATFLAAALILIISVSREALIQFINAVKNRPVDTDFIFLALWLLMMMITVTLLLPHATAKYILPFLAPTVLLLVRELKRSVNSSSTIIVVAIACISLTFVTGSFVASADNKLAQNYKDFALAFAGRYDPQGTVWFVGEWGFRHYMEAQGYRYLTSASTEPREGDLIVRASLMDWPLQKSVTDRIFLIDEFEEESANPVHVMSIEADAGFYGSYWGFMPYVIAGVPVERYKVYHVGPELASRH